MKINWQEVADVEPLTQSGEPMGMVGNVTAKPPWVYVMFDGTSWTVYNCKIIY